MKRIKKLHNWGGFGFGFFHDAKFHNRPFQKALDVLVSLFVLALIPVVLVLAAFLFIIVFAFSALAFAVSTVIGVCKRLVRRG